MADILSIYNQNKWKRQQLRDKFENNRWVGTYYRSKSEKAPKHKAKRNRRSKRWSLQSETKSDVTEYIIYNTCILCNRLKEENEWETIDCKLCIGYLLSKLPDLAEDSTYSPMTN